MTRESVRSARQIARQETAVNAILWIFQIVVTGVLLLAGGGNLA